MKLKVTLPSYRIVDIQEGERPRERLAKIGAKDLRKAEPLAILLRTGIRGENAVQMGDRLLNQWGGLAGIQQISFDELRQEWGVSLAKAAQIKAAFELGVRTAQLKPESKPTVNNPANAADLVRYEMSILEQEVLRVMLLDTRNRVLRTLDVYQGSLNKSMVRVGEVLKQAIRQNAASIILIHNHPCGDPTPSPEDVALTRAVVQTGKLLDIDVLDHLMIAGGKFVSLKEKGLGFSA